ncbi:ABC transporter ATP-binding protein [Comamonas endophytica]|uniref:ABC transporter ATP-binding protein n=1 Tax=Comamonas endophytica TaxID=2949090 RepID=A0ABY6GCF9_9BURK|nr:MULTISPECIES: ABC transporter ATP-binding protein [unclassified Acidovorax]MCD2513966.1 ABC transporter ATP-binding protein [Acidovorax sp. D4N7]UYG52042.1 ABC transporter ATP-binding protein [Acidovorax sp. 5MLIR]
MSVHVPGAGWALQAEHLSVSLGGLPVLRDLTLRIAAGRWTSIVGPNGAGKSTLLRALAGMAQGQGQVLLLGRALADWSSRERARTLAWLGQDQAVSPEISVYDAAMLGRLPHQSWLGAASAQDHAAVEQALRRTQSWAWRGRSLGQLSGGERQRVLLARALAVQARVLLMDEPLAHLDPPHQADWLDCVQQLVAQGTTVVSVLHELSMALQAQELLVLAQGRVLHQGGCADPASHAALEQVFAQRVQVRAIDGQWVALPRLLHRRGP